MYAVARHISFGLRMIEMKKSTIWLILSIIFLVVYLLIPSIEIYVAFWGATVIANLKDD